MKKILISLLLITLVLVTSCTPRVCSKNSDCVLYQTTTKELTSVPVVDVAITETYGYLKYTKNDAKADCFKGMCVIYQNNKLITNEGDVLE